MSRDTFDAFQPQERGRFGDNEFAADQPARLKGGAKLHDLAMILHVDMERPRAVLAGLTEDRRAAVWLPKSQVEIVTIGPQERKLRGIVIQAVRITLPEWLAKEKGLI